MTRIKICGLTDPGDAEAAALAGADYLGFVFAPSPRRVDTGLAAAFRRDLPGLPLVAVFMDQAAREVSRVVDRFGPDILQFHGGESPDFCRRFGLPVIRALPLARESDLSKLEPWVDEAEMLLVDLPKGEAGGVLPAELARNAALLGPPLFVAGGLTPLNVGAVVAAVGPFGVDVARGVETSPGRKDAGKMRRFVEEVRRATSMNEGETR